MPRHRMAHHAMPFQMQYKRASSTEKKTESRCTFVAPCVCVCVFVCVCVCACVCMSTVPNARQTHIKHMNDNTYQQVRVRNLIYYLPWRSPFCPNSGSVGSTLIPQSWWCFPVRITFSTQRHEAHATHYTICHTNLKPAWRGLCMVLLIVLSFQGRLLVSRSSIRPCLLLFGAGFEQSRSHGAQDDRSATQRENA